MYNRTREMEQSYDFLEFREGGDGFDGHIWCVEWVDGSSCLTDDGSVPLYLYGWISSAWWAQHVHMTCLKDVWSKAWPKAWPFRARGSGSQAIVSGRLRSIALTPKDLKGMADTLSLLIKKHFGATVVLFPVDVAKQTADWELFRTYCFIQFNELLLLVNSVQLALLVAAMSPVLFSAWIR